MKKWMTLVFLCLLVPVGLLGCSEENGEEGNPWDDVIDSGSGSDEVDYLCFQETDVDLEACGPYPTEEGWDMGNVVTNLTFAAYYDRNCDGIQEATTMNMYRDIYCHRDKIKSVVILAGSSCGEDEGII